MAVEVVEEWAIIAEGNLETVAASIDLPTGQNRYILAGVNYESGFSIATNSMRYGGVTMAFVGFARVSNPETIVDGESVSTINADIVYFGIGEDDIQNAVGNALDATFTASDPNEGPATGVFMACSMTGVDQADPHKTPQIDVGGNAEVGPPGAGARTVVESVDAGGAIFGAVNMGLGNIATTWAGLTKQGGDVTVGSQTATYGIASQTFPDAIAMHQITNTHAGSNRSALLTISMNPAAEVNPPVEPSTGRVTPLDLWQLVATTQTSARNGQAFQISSGVDRLLVVSYSDLSDRNQPTQMRFGGQVMTQRTSFFAQNGQNIGLQQWTLSESGIQAAVGNLIQATVPTTANAEVRLFAASFTSVDQAAPVQDTDVGQQGGASPGVAQLKAFATTDGGRGIFHWANENVATTPNATWIDGANEVFEQPGTTSYNSIAEAATTGQPIFPKVSPASPHFRNVIVGMTIRPSEAVGGVVQEFSATGAAVSTGNLSNFIVAGEDEFAAQGIAISTGSVRFLVDRPVDPNEVTIGRLVGRATSSGTFNTTQVIALSFQGNAVSSGSMEFVGGGIDLVSPLDREFTIAQSFVDFERPVIMIDLFFDEGEVNIWTRAFEGRFEGKLYQPVAGITGSLSIRQTLDQPGFESSVQLTGLSPEIVAIGNRSQFQMRPANIRLGNIGDNGDVFIAETIVPGRIQNITVVDDIDDPSVSIEIDSIFNDINIPRARRLSSADQKRFFPGDTFFDFVESARMQTPRFGG